MHFCAVVCWCLAASPLVAFVLTVGKNNVKTFWNTDDSIGLLTRRNKLLLLSTEIETRYIYNNNIIRSCSMGLSLSLNKFKVMSVSWVRSSAIYKTGRYNMSDSEMACCGGYLFVLGFKLNYLVLLILDITSKWYLLRKSYWFHPFIKILSFNIQINLIN